ncbi:MAG: BlaI/MecI/CopY family transcriptional regulator [Gemmataceae bacterium]|nr:BlaI/MecI/CopY family transcriptional regulator [Gemmataceae bacterium]
MGPRLPNIADAEWAVLQQLWEQGPATVRQLTDVLYPKGGASEYATVHKLLERLEAKGYVGRDRSTGVYVFQAAVDRDAVIGQQLETLVEKMCGGSLQPLLSHLLKAKRLTPQELRELRALVDSLEPKSKPKKDRV